MLQRKTYVNGNKSTENSFSNEIRPKGRMLQFQDKNSSLFCCISLFTALLLVFAVLRVAMDRWMKEQYEEGKLAEGGMEGGTEEDRE